MSPSSGETAGIWLVTGLSSILPWNKQREILETANMELQAIFQPVLSGISRELPSEDVAHPPWGTMAQLLQPEQGKSFLRGRPLLEMEALCALWDCTLLRE